MTRGSRNKPRKNLVRPSKQNQKTKKPTENHSVPEQRGFPQAKPEKGERKEAGSDACIKDTEVTARRKCTRFQGDCHAATPSRPREPRRWKTTLRRALVAVTTTRGPGRPETAASAPAAAQVRSAARTGTSAPGLGRRSWKSGHSVAITLGKET